MAKIVTISLSPQDEAYLKEEVSLSKSKLFREALYLNSKKDEFMDIYNLNDFYIALKDRERKIERLIKEIERRNERIESLQDVLAQKEISE